jgi:hypothetical protein
MDALLIVAMFIGLRLVAFRSIRRQLRQERERQARTIYIVHTRSKRRNWRR